MRTDRRNQQELVAELREGRMRQGWGYLPELDLRTIADRRQDDQELSDDQTAAWKRCHRLLPEEDDSVEVGDIVILPHLPRERRWSLARVTGDYHFERLRATDDHGHVREAELLYEDVDWHHPGTDARLRSTMRNAYPMWNIDRLGAAVDSLLGRLASVERSPEPALAGGYLDDTLDVLADTLWEQIEKRYTAGEFEREPVRWLLEAVFGEGSVEHTAGPSERGADFICTRDGPLGTPETTAVQVKMWEGDLDAAALGQIERAREEWPLITSGVMLTTAEREPDDVAQARNELEKKLDIPIRVILRREFLELFLRHLPGMAGASAE